MLKLKCGPLEIKFDEVTQEFFLNGKRVESQPRVLGQVYDVLYDKLFAAVADQGLPQYFMYRGVSRKQDEGKLKKGGLKFDVTVMPPMMLGKEFNKTFGHYHEPVRGTPLPELYEVLHGQAHFLIQKPIHTTTEVEEVWLFKAKEGDKVIIPPLFGHVVINPSKTKLLVTMKAADKSLKNDYKAFIEKKGAAYYELSDGFQKNPHYINLPRIKIMKPGGTKIFPKRKCIYKIFLQSPEKFAFLSPPPRVVAAPKALATQMS